MADVICVLVPLSDAACQEFERLAAQDCPYIAGRDDTNSVDIDYGPDDSADFSSHRHRGDYTLVLRLGDQVKDPQRGGFLFGRAAQHCDVVFHNDPYRRVSKVHFRIFLNQHGVLMVEDMSTNGTIVDGMLLNKDKKRTDHTMWMLQTGTKVKVVMHLPSFDNEFLVRVPRREGVWQARYQRNLRSYLAKIYRPSQPQRAPNDTIVPGPNGHVRSATRSNSLSLPPLSKAVPPR